MYTTYFKLLEKPFEKMDIPKFFWNGGGRADQFENLYNCVLENGGLLLLTGAEGLGKTTNAKALIRRLQNDVICGLVTAPLLDRLEFYHAISRSFSLERSYTSRVDFLLYFGQFLQGLEQNQKRVLLTVDNSHTLSQDLLEELRSLSNLRNADGSRFINILMTGRQSLVHLLDHPKNLLIRQQVALHIDLSPLNHQEVIDYINHRMDVAGSHEPLFSEDAITLIWQHSNGSPEDISTLCERALQLGANQGRDIIDRRVIEQAIDPLVDLVSKGEQNSVKVPKSKLDVEETVSLIKLKAEKAKTLLSIILKRINQNHLIKSGIGIFLIAVLSVVIFNLPSPREHDNSREREPGIVETNPRQVAGVEKTTEVTAVEVANPAITEQQEKDEEKPIKRITNFWQSQKKSQRLVKIARQKVEEFTDKLTGFPDTVLLLRSNDSEQAEKFVREMQELLMKKGIDPAQIKTMKPKEKEFLETIAEIAHEEGHQVIEIIVVRDGIWWGEVGGEIRHK